MHFKCILNAQVRAAAADAVGDIGLEAAQVQKGAATKALISVLTNAAEHPYVVRNSVEALVAMFITDDRFCIKHDGLSTKMMNCFI